jgi:GNAT superfamily N-acetyltransferase
VVFSPVVIQHWIGGIPNEANDIRVVLDPSLRPNRSVSLVKVSGGPTVLAVTPRRASELSLSAARSVDTGELAARLAAAGITLHDPDYLFYLAEADQAALRTEAAYIGTRQLTMADGEAFGRFVRAAPEQDVAEAFVELDHWLVFGTFVDGALVAAASMYPWGDTRLADLGVLTLPGYRGRGMGRATVRAISARAIELGYEPQYRCQVDNAPSVALARSAGFALFGKWQVLDTQD